MSLNLSRSSRIAVAALPCPDTASTRSSRQRRFGRPVSSSTRDRRSCSSACSRIASARRAFLSATLRWLPTATSSRRSLPPKVSTSPSRSPTSSVPIGSPSPCRGMTIASRRPARRSAAASARSLVERRARVGPAVAHADSSWASPDPGASSAAPPKRAIHRWSSPAKSAVSVSSATSALRAVVIQVSAVRVADSTSTSAPTWPVKRLSSSRLSVRRRNRLCDRCAKPSSATSTPTVHSARQSTVTT